MNPRPLGYEPYDVCLCRLASSLVVALTSADGWLGVHAGLRRLPRLNPSRHVSCTNPCTNLVVNVLFGSIKRRSMTRFGQPTGRRYLAVGYRRRMRLGSRLSISTLACELALERSSRIVCEGNRVQQSLMDGFRHGVCCTRVLQQSSHVSRPAAMGAGTGVMLLDSGRAVESLARRP